VVIVRLLLPSSKIFSLWLATHTLGPCAATITPLQELDVSCNALARLPKRLDACAALDYLSLAGNQLAGLPGGLHLPPSLRWLDLSDNQLAGLPAAILTARQLQVGVVGLSAATGWREAGECALAAAQGVRH
jgi:hypothetical protein